MKFLLGAILILSLILLGIYIYKTVKEIHKLALTVRWILITGWIIIFVNFISLFSESESVILLTYTLYFGIADWLLYYLLKFSIEYIGNKFEDYVKKKFLILLLLADSISMLLNNVFHHQFYIEKVIMFGGEVYFKLQLKPFFYIHYGIIILLVSLCLVSLIYRAIKAPLFYRNKYIIIAVILILLAILNAIAFETAIDVSIIGYVVEGICIYYCAFVYTPQKLLPKTLAMVAQDMSIGLLVLDIEGKTVFENECAKSYFDENVPCIDEKDVLIKDWCNNSFLERKEEFSKEKIFYYKDEERIFKINLRYILDSNNVIQGGYFEITDRTEEIMEMERQKYLANHDELTGLYKKDHFYKMSEEYIRDNKDQELLMICTDIKGFKMVNDILGTEIGDKVLVNFADILRQEIDGAIVYGRLGNDVFGVLLEKNKFSDNIFDDDIKEKLIKNIGISFNFQIVNYVGVYEITDYSIPVSVMCDRARMAISTIKGDYHKRISFYNDEIRTNIVYEQELVNDLKEAIDKNQFKMYLQPQMNSEGKLLGAEALVRWQHPKKGLVLPGAFIQVFERNGLISEIDYYIWEQACKLLKKWKDEGREELYISVNISPKDFYLLDIFEIFTELVKKYEINPANIKLEITETAIVMDFNRQLNLIKKLRGRGFVVEMDDFGSGYSSLNMLKDLHVDVLKIDMAFLKKAKDEDRSKKILQMIISLSKQLGMPVITEGVESEEQINFLKEMGCEMFQGYYFAKPMEVQKFEELYLN